MIPELGNQAVTAQRLGMKWWMEDFWVMVDCQRDDHCDDLCRELPHDTSDVVECFYRVIHCVYGLGVSLALESIFFDIALQSLDPLSMFFNEIVGLQNFVAGLCGKTMRIVPLCSNGL